MGKYFGTDGFRGEANVTLTVEHAFKIGRFIGWYFLQQKKKNNDNTPPKILIGKDTRRSSYMFEYTLISGLTASGADGYLLHVTTTPSVAYIARTDGFDCAVMISASHNPFYDNGIKLIDKNGEKMNENFTDLLESYIDGNLVYEGTQIKELPYATGENIGKTIDYVAGRNRYIGYLISLGKFSFKGKKIGLDCANGSAWYIAKAVFDALGAQTFTVGCEPNGVNINNGVGSTHIENLKKFVLKNNLDIGFAYDGDADRCICVDEKGNEVNGDHILYLCAKYMKDNSELANNHIVTTVMSNFGLFKSLDKLGIEYSKTQVGDRFVYEEMQKSGYVLGGEQSGHIIFSKYATTGDGILTSLMIMEVLISSKLSMSKLISDLKIYPQTLINVKVSDKKKVLSNDEVKSEIEKAEKALAGTGRVLVRASGTEQLIRVMVEAPTEKTAKKLAKNIADVVSKVD